MGVELVFAGEDKGIMVEQGRQEDEDLVEQDENGCGVKKSGKLQP